MVFVTTRCVKPHESGVNIVDVLPVCGGPFFGVGKTRPPRVPNIYSRNTKAGNFIVVNKYLIAALKKLDMWNTKVEPRACLVRAGGGACVGAVLT